MGHTELTHKHMARQALAAMLHADLPKRMLDAMTPL